MQRGDRSSRSPLDLVTMVNRAIIGMALKLVMWSLVGAKLSISSTTDAQRGRPSSANCKVTKLFSAMGRSAKVPLGCLRSCGQV